MGLKVVPPAERDWADTVNHWEKRVKKVGPKPAFTCLKLTIETLEQGFEICSKLTVKTPYFTSCFSVSVLNFEHVNAGWERLEEKEMELTIWYWEMNFNIILT